MDTTQYPFYRHWDTWCVHYLWHPVMPFEWSRVRNLSPLSTYSISNLIDNVKFFSVFLFFSFVPLEKSPLRATWLIPCSLIFWHLHNHFSYWLEESSHPTQTFFEGGLKGLPKLSFNLHLYLISSWQGCQVIFMFISKSTGRYFESSQQSVRLLRYLHFL